MAVSKVKFRSQFDPHERIYQEPGDGDKILYSPVLQEDGTIELEVSGKDDLYASIQSHKDSCDIHVLLNQYRNGDDAALSRMQGVYGDFTQMPKTFAEALNAMIAGEQMFNSLPVETREKFDFSLHKFMLAMDDMPNFLATLGVSPDSDLPPSAKPASDPQLAPADPSSDPVGGDSNG